MALADVRRLRERVLAAGGSIVHESPGSPHVHPLLPTPEGRAARRVFLDAVVAGGCAWRRHCRTAYSGWLIADRPGRRTSMPCTAASVCCAPSGSSPRTG